MLSQLTLPSSTLDKKLRNTLLKIYLKDEEIKSYVKEAMLMRQDASKRLRILKGKIAWIKAAHALKIAEDANNLGELT